MLYVWRAAGHSNWCHRGSLCTAQLLQHTVRLKTAGVPQQGRPCACGVHSFTCHVPEPLLLVGVKCHMLLLCPVWKQVSCSRRIQRHHISSSSSSTQVVRADPRTPGCFLSCVPLFHHHIMPKTDECDCVQCQLPVPASSCSAYHQHHQQ